MGDLICLKELEKPYVYQSQLNYLTQSSTTTYCVLAENTFIVFKKPSDIISLFRIPMNKITRVKFKEKEFTICYYEFSFKFQHRDSVVIALWNDHLNAAIKNDIQELNTQVHAEVVRIDKIQRNECPIVISKTDCRLFIYQSYDYQRCDICTHVINLKFYRVDVLEPAGKVLKVLTIKNDSSMEFKLTFKEPSIAVDWIKILRNSIERKPEESILSEIKKNKSNNYCVDCGVSDPKWVSINICVTLCDDCVGLHRNLGTGISRTQSVLLDVKCWKDSSLARLINEIGNDIAKGFWCKNLSNGERPTIEQKYKHKLFIDTSFLNLSADQRFEKLALSVRTSDIVETMKLWFSCPTDFERETVDKLLRISREFGQRLQEKFLSLQENIRKDQVPDSLAQSPVFERVFHLTYNTCEPMTQLFLVSLYGDRVTIRKESSNILSKENIVVCTIYLQSITAARLTSSNNSFQIFLYPHSPFLTNDQNGNSNNVIISSLSLLDSSDISLKKLKLFLFNILLPDSFAPPINETLLFLLVDVTVNENDLGKCKCHLTKNELVFSNPVDVKYDLRRIETLKISDNKTKVNMRICNDNISLQTNDRSPFIFDCLNEASKLSLVPLLEANFVDLINFIKFYGLTVDKIFEIDGKPERVDCLFQKWLQSPDMSVVNSGEYTAHDVASCLKKCLVFLEECLIPQSIFSKFKIAAYADQEDDKRYYYKNSFKLLPEENFKILSHLIELMFFINRMSDCNHMNEEKLSRVLARFILSPIEDDFLESNAILKYFIENFVVLFDYSADDQINMLIFIDKIVTTPRRSVLRTFYINGSLLNLTNTQNLKDSGQIQLVFLDKINSFSTVTLTVNNFPLVIALYQYMFTTITDQTAYLWHFTYVKNKVFKCLLYANDNVTKVITKRPKFPTQFNLDKEMDMFIFLPNESEACTQSTDNTFQCLIKIRNERALIKTNHQRFIQIALASNSLKIYKCDCGITDNVFLLSDVHLYRSHGSATNNIYILCPDSVVLCCEFLNSENFKEFFSFFDRFKMNILL